MPRVEPHELSLKTVAEALSNSAITAIPPLRRPGYHVSGLLRATSDFSKGQLRVSDAYREPNNQSELADLPPGLLDWGHLWEAAARPVAEEVARNEGLVTTGPVRGIVEGIHGNADGLVLNADGNIHAILEFKFRFSDRTSPMYQEKWLRQTKAYCHMWGTRIVWFIVGHVRSRPPGGGACRYVVTYADSEIAETWTAMTAMRGRLEQE